MRVALVALGLGWHAAPAESQRSSEHERGRAALRDGRNDEAARILHQAYAREGTPALLLDLAVAHARRGQPNRAAEAYHVYLLATGSDAPNAWAVREELRRLRKANAVLVLELDPKDAKILIDGAPMRIIGGEVLATPGSHTLRVAASGYEAFEQSVDFPKGRVALRLALVPLPGTVVPPPTVIVPPMPGVPAAPGAGPRRPGVGSRPALATSPADREPGRASTPLTGRAPQDRKRRLWVGPVATFGIFAPLGVGFHARYRDYLAFGADLQLLPSLGENEIAITSGTAFLQAHPTGGLLFFSGGFGLYHISAVDSDRGTKAQGSLTFPGLCLGFGLMGHDGFVLGFDLTVLVPLANPAVGFSIVEGSPSRDEAALLELSVRTTIDDVKSFLPVIPQLNLLRIGWLF